MIATLVQEFYSSLPDDIELVFDTSRDWSAMLPVILAVYPSAQCFCCVRNVSEVINSFEHALLVDPLSWSKIYPGASILNAPARAEHLLSSRGLIGASLNNLNDGCYGPHASSVVLIRYSTLVKDPRTILSMIYERVGEPDFTHNTSHVEFTNDELDRTLGMPGLHTVKGPVEVRRRENILSPAVENRCRGLEFWDVPTITSGVTIL